ncbi:MAG: zinc metalloprotease HtpX [Bacteriovoracia bacterium]
MGSAFAGSQGVLLGFIISISINFFSYWFSDKIVLAMHSAQPVSPGQSQGLYEMVERLASVAQIPMPKVYIIPDHSPNAFATGRNPYHSAVAVTQGLLGVLNHEELEGVLAHEISHIKNRDTLISTIAATLASAILFLSNMMRWAAVFGGHSRDSERDDNGGGALGLVAMAIFAPIAATLIQFAVSRSREFIADSTGARLCGNPQWLASALRKIHDMSTVSPLSEGSPATAHLYIVNPFSSGAFINLFSTHPPVEERVARLLEMKFA